MKRTLLWCLAGCGVFALCRLAERLQLHGATLPISLLVVWAVLLALHGANGEPDRKAETPCPQR